MSKVDDIAKQFEDAVRKAFSRVYGPPRDQDVSQSVRSSWSDASVKQGWHDPDPGVVIIGTEYGWIADPWSYDRNEHKNWEKAMDHLRKAGWDDVNFESINSAVHYVYWMPPQDWQSILNKRIRDRMNP
jgi:hypothetical protein